MASIIKRKNSWQVTIRRSVLPRPHYATFDTEAEARAYGMHVESMIDSGNVPAELLSESKVPDTLGAMVRQYLMESGSISAMDQEIMGLPAIQAISGVLARELTVAWALRWVDSLKRESKLAPGSIRKRVGTLARCLDWHVRRQNLAVNPLKQLPIGYSAYSRADGVKREDESRDRRLAPDEERKIRLVLAGDRDYMKLVGRERTISDKNRTDFVVLFDLALETAMRLREMYTLRVAQVDLSKRTVFLDKTKNGDKRQVPLSSVAMTVLSDFLATRDANPDALIFHLWNGEDQTLRDTTRRISVKFARIFELAGCPDLRFHDLRHEATSRLFERTTLTDLQISKITGHKSMSMLSRYANLRGSDLAERLW
jgi:integrase